VPPNAYQLLPYVVAVLPLALAALASAFWWNALTRPWIFFAVGAAALYGALAVALLVAILTVQPNDPPGSSPIHSFDVGVALGLIVFLAMGFGIVWSFKLRLSKP